MIKSVVVVGGVEGTHVAASLFRAASGVLPARLCDVRIAMSSYPLLNGIWFRLFDRQSPRSDRLEAAVIKAVAHSPSPLLLTTGSAPIRAAALKVCRERATCTAHFSTDDPWNPSSMSGWYFDAITQYDIVFTPRRSNIADFTALGVREVRWLPFGYDSGLFGGDPNFLHGAPDILFVGGADRDRAEFFDRFCAAGLEVCVVGGYWSRMRNARRHDLGLRSPADVAALTQATKIAVILVRRANRDGHTMRSFEAGAIGACLLVEDTEEHRHIFGADGECVVYFDSPEGAAASAKALLANEPKRRRLAKAVQQRIRGGANAYTDRLATMLEEVESLAPSAERKST